MDLIPNPTEIDDIFRRVHERKNDAANDLFALADTWLDTEIDIAFNRHNLGLNNELKRTTLLVEGLRDAFINLALRVSASAKSYTYNKFVEELRASFKSSLLKEVKRQRALKDYELDPSQRTTRQYRSPADEVESKDAEVNLWKIVDEVGQTNSAGYRSVLSSEYSRVELDKSLKDPETIGEETSHARTKFRAATANELAKPSNIQELTPAWVPRIHRRDLFRHAAPSSATQIKNAQKELEACSAEISGWSRQASKNSEKLKTAIGKIHDFLITHGVEVEALAAAFEKYGDDVELRLGSPVAQKSRVFAAIIRDPQDGLQKLKDKLQDVEGYAIKKAAWYDFESLIKSLNVQGTKDDMYNVLQQVVDAYNILSDISSYLHAVEQRREERPKLLKRLEEARDRAEKAALR